MPTGQLFQKPRTEDVQASIDACLDNGSRLLNDAVQLEFQEQGGTRFMICVLAQEEYAKAFLLYLVREEIVPWDSDLLRVMKNHACKHLVAILMEYIDPQWDTSEELAEIYRLEYDLDGRFPPNVRSALNILYFEIIRRGDFFDDDNEYERDVVAIARGQRDRVKQNAVYINVDKSCRVKGSPMKLTREDAQAEYQRAKRYASTVQSLVSKDAYEGLQLKKLKEATKIVFWQKYKPVESKEN